jgi:hypothetical protein
MNVIYHEKPRQDDAPVLEQVTGWLEEVLRISPEPVEAEWDRAEDEHGQSVYTLTLRNFAGEVKERFAAADLAHTTDLRARVYGLLGELLRVRDHELLRRFHEANREDRNGPDPH